MILCRRFGVGALALALAGCATAPPAAQCKEGDRRCDSTGTMEITCVRDSTGQLRFGQPVACAGGRCQDGACTDTCGTCAAPPGPCFRSPGSCFGGQCRYDILENGATCDDADACTSEDTCVDGQCKGKAMSCTAAPGNVCKNANTLTVYATPGACSAGKCVYPSADVNCPSGCDSAGCKGDPCQGVTCDRPPNQQCYLSPGICSSGSCTYLVKTAQNCDDGNLCTKTDKCDDKGTCAGTAYTCNDGKTCTVDTCNGTGGCTYPPDPSSCLINNVCYAAKGSLAGNSCQYCDPKTPTVWTLATGTAFQTWNFDDGTLQGFTVAATTSPVKWQVDKQRSDSPSYSLYFGNVATHTYDDPNKVVTGQVTSPAVAIPSGAGKLCLVFRMFKNTEAGGFDKITVTLLPAAKDLFLSASEPLGATTPDPAKPGSFIFKSFAAEIPSGTTGSVQLRFAFDSVDAIANATEGVYIDTIQLLKNCTP
jgi:hypothetical protein